MNNDSWLMERIKQNPDLGETIRFHGHMCPGLAIGYRAAKASLERLGVARAEDEELIAIVENDSCSVDAVQWLTGCTFGKGNFIFRDYGKQVFTFLIRPSGRAVRMALKRSNLSADQDREARIQRILTAPLEDVFEVKEFTAAVPPPAQIRDTLVCEFCGEGVMATRTVVRDGLTSCIPCSEQMRSASE